MVGLEGERQLEGRELGGEGSEPFLCQPCQARALPPAPSTAKW